MITNQRTFGARFGNSNAGTNAGTSNSSADKPKAQYWLNIGYETGDATYPFVSLPNGIPLDITDALTVTGKPEFAQFRTAQNELLEQLIEQAADLEPGEDAIISHPDMPLAMQLRRVRGEVAPISSAENPLSRPNMFKAVDVPVDAPAGE